MESSIITAKGQIAIPKLLRDKYQLKPGTKVYFEETTYGINLRQINPDFIKKAKGIIPKTKDKKRIDEWWPKYKADEITLEDRKLNLHRENEIYYKRAIKINRKS